MKANQAIADYAKRKAIRTSGSLLLKLIKYIGIPTLIIGFCLIIIITGIASQTEKEVRALGLSDKQSGDKLDGIKVGKATYVGVNDKDTPLSKAILAQTNMYSERRNPYLGRYKNLCLAWVCDMYQQAGYKPPRTCCAYRSSINSGIKKGKIPKGAIIYSGLKPDGTFYENFHTAGCFCTVCNSWAGHVGIYIGNGVVVGSQIPYKMSLDAFIDTFGYGGYYIGG